MPLLYSLLIYAVLSWPSPGRADPDPPQILQSVSGDVVHLHRGVARKCADIPCRVSVCLENIGQNKTSKGLGQHRNQTPPRAIAPGAVGCLDLAALRQTLVLWAPNPAGTLAPVIVAPLDLRNRPGALVWLNWLVEAPSKGSTP